MTPQNKKKVKVARLQDLWRDSLPVAPCSQSPTLLGKVLDLPFLNSFRTSAPTRTFAVRAWRDFVFGADFSFRKVSRRKSGECISLQCTVIRVEMNHDSKVE